VKTFLYPLIPEQYRHLMESACSQGILQLIHAPNHEAR